MSQGRTKEEALANIQEAIQLCLEVRAERGLPLTIETREVESDEKEIKERFEKSLKRVRARAKALGITQEDIEAEIRAVREERARSA